jgi:hypothetical protein
MRDEALLKPLVVFFRRTRMQSERWQESKVLKARTCFPRGFTTLTYVRASTLFVAVWHICSFFLRELNVISNLLHALLSHL